MPLPTHCRWKCKKLCTSRNLASACKQLLTNHHPVRRLESICNAIKTAEANPKINSLVVSSSLGKIFCAGLDLTELYKPDADRLPKFWTAFQQLYLDLYGSRLATVAAIGGHAPAAGCMIALSCDYRIFSSNGGKIGLNEAVLGLSAPPFLGQQYVDTIGHRRAELALSMGTLFDPNEALQIGLVDEVVEEDVLEVAKKMAVKMARIPPSGRLGSKKFARDRQIQMLLDKRQEDCDTFCAFAKEDAVQGALGAYLEQMSARKK